MTQKNSINIVDSTEFVEGIIVELSETNSTAFDVKRYYINEYQKMEVENLEEIFIGEIYPCAKSLEKAVEIIKRKVRNISKSKKIYLSSEVVDLLSSQLR